MDETPKLPFDLQNDEHVLLFARRHWAFLASSLAKNLLIGLIPVVAVLILVGKTAGLDGRLGQVTWVLVALWVVFWGVRLYFDWYRYNRDIWVVTNQRVVDSVKKHWFHHSMASADLDDVEDISIKKEGIFPTMFNFGNLLLQTAGERPNFVLSGIPEPSKILALVDQTRDAAKRKLRGL